ncbi:hypothetical protein [Cupriavidus basilensis]|uniref:hypothetical protein n=1 Tax=Cupriavidus basilensis TaxID=68895 RepID=UPI0005B86FB9|nr:hypothetical protein [Cupriavidus basilensis]
MDELDLCRIADTLPLTAVAALLAGSRPSRVQAPDKSGVNRYHLLRLDRPGGDEIGETPEVFDTALQMLMHAAGRGTLKADKVYTGVWTLLRSRDGSIPRPHHCEAVGALDPHATTVAVDDLTQWLARRGVRSCFFFPEDARTLDYLEPTHERHSPRLAAAVKAWQAMEDENLRRRKSPKVAMEQWLESNYKVLGLVHKRDSRKHGYKEGDMNKSAVAEAAKVANWVDGGGAPRTPVE